MIKYKFAEHEFNEQIKEANDRCVKVTYKNKEPFVFPCEIPVTQIWTGNGKDRKVSELIIYNIADYTKKNFNINELLYKTVLFVSETENTWNIGKAYIRGIMYKDDNTSSEIDYCYIGNYEPYLITGDDFTDEVNRVVGGMLKDKLYIEDILEVL